VRAVVAVIHLILNFGLADPTKEQYGNNLFKVLSI
jgi:hypothetical protein